jgi:hypothetical protein
MKKLIKFVFWFFAGFIFSAYVISENCRAEGADYSWSKFQTGEEFATTALLFIDYRQSLYIQTVPGAYETNQLLGKHPTNKAIKNYFIGSELIQLGVAQSFPLIRTPFLGGMIILEGSVTARNRIIGFAFKW